MNKALKGILATYGVEEVVSTLLWLASDGIRNPNRPEYEEIRNAQNEINNDVDLVSYLMECHGVTDPNTGVLAKLPDIAPWRFDNDKDQFEKDGEKLRIEKLEWVEE